MISEGFGSSNTIRGTRDNRILSEGLAWANMELRIKLVSFKLINQFFYIAVNPFFDCGVVTKGYRTDVFEQAFNRTDASLSPYGDATIYNPARDGEVISTAGAGLKIAMNQNFIISAEFSHCFNEGMGEPVGIGIGINYQF